MNLCMLIQVVSQVSHAEVTRALRAQIADLDHQLQLTKAPSPYALPVCFSRYFNIICVEHVHSLFLTSIYKMVLFVFLFDVSFCTASVEHERLYAIKFPGPRPARPSTQRL